MSAPVFDESDVRVIEAQMASSTPAFVSKEDFNKSFTEMKGMITSLTQAFVNRSIIETDNSESEAIDKINNTEMNPQAIQPDSSNPSSTIASKMQLYLIAEGLEPVQERSLFIPENIKFKVSASATISRLVSILLEYFYAYGELRNMTLSGYKWKSNIVQTKEGNPSEKSASKIVKIREDCSVLDPQFIRKIEAAVLKQFPITGIEPNSRAFDDAVSRQKKDIRSTIRTKLQYYKKWYTDDGMKTPFKKQKCHKNPQSASEKTNDGL